MRSGIKFLLSLLVFLSFAGQVAGQSTGMLIPNAEQTFVDANGDPLAAGKVYFYIPSTLTPKNTWSDQSMSSLNTNPVVLDSAGRAKIWGAGTYRQIVRDVNGNLIWDQVTSVEGGEVTSAVPWNVVADVAAMQALGADASIYTSVQTQAYRTGSGKGGAFYTWDAVSTTNDCIHVAVTGVGTGRYVLRTDLQNDSILPTQCGAYFDADATANSGHDDTTYWNAAEAVAVTYKLMIGPIGGTTKLLDTVNAGAGVVHQGTGQGQLVVNCRFTAHDQCFYIQNANGTNQIEAPKFFDMTINQSGVPGSGNGGVGIKYNSVAGGFTDDNTTQAYMGHPIVQRVTFSGGAQGIQCSKCFDGQFSDIYFTGLDYSVNLQGSDFITVARNQIHNYGIAGLITIVRGTFSNMNVFDRNDIGDSSQMAVNSPIVSTARSIRITNNSMEDNQPGHTQICQINIGEGQSAVIENNLLNVIGATNSICIAGDTWYNLHIANNNVATGAVPNPIFNAGAGLPIWINSGAKTQLTHFNNRPEANFPMNVQTHEAVGQGRTAMYVTPSTLSNVSYANYGASVYANADARNAPAFVLPAAAFPGSAIDLVNTTSMAAQTYDVCIIGSTDNPATNAVKIQYYDGGVLQSTTSVLLSHNNPELKCPAALAGITPATSASFTLYNDGAGLDYIEAFIVTLQ